MSGYLCILGLGRISGHFQYPAGYQISSSIIFYILQRKSLLFKKLKMAVILLLLKLEEHFFLLEISKHKFWGWQLYLAAASRSNFICIV